ncbi:tyrosine-type recombinase/integrase [Lysinibacillus yapensis]|uniref:tyrosine-type recombinase/integrase n=1 Tax=Ureibacillus yapensis TaxID=2304605 RepID=UPI0013142101|nr:tyrosine-type recombinase/integrase [Lysinibacillus yapensis]
MDQYLVFYRSYLESIGKSPHTIKQYCIDTEQFLSFMLKNEHTFDTPIKEIVAAYNQQLEENYSSPASINRKKASLKHFLHFLQMRNVIAEIPVHLLTPLKQQKEKLKYYTKQQIEQILNYWFELIETALIPEHRWLALRNFCIVNIMAELGTKPSEVTRMKWTHLKQQEITILQRKRIRTLCLSDSMIDWLEIYKNETKSLLPSSENAAYMWLGLGNKQNEPITVKTIERIYKTISNQVGFKVTPTSMRYTLMNSEVKTHQDEQLKDLYLRYGYARKSVLVDRVNRFKEN